MIVTLGANLCWSGAILHEPFGIGGSPTNVLIRDPDRGRRSVGCGCRVLRPSDRFLSHLIPLPLIQVRCFALERDSEFVYLALERCQSALADVVEISVTEGGSVLPLLQLLGEDAQPKPLAWSIAQDIGQGLMFLHDQGFVHRDLKASKFRLLQLSDKFP